ncbi:unnamed protein product [Arctia plantaginis]|uniref:Uncharacterized protein n=1 Tax=Arctia plantaginis TaxID=874455 RepID=A0A8S1AEJ1_ARCPL|nr:unnamed protein product [Arctia plantaginis]
MKADRRKSHEIREIKRKYSSTSDYWALYTIQEDWMSLMQEQGRTASDEYCSRYSLRGDRLAYIRSLSNLHLEQLLKSSMIAPTTEAEELNRFSDIEELMCGVLLSGADSLLVTNRHIKTKGKMSTVTDIFTSTGDRAHIGSESVNHNITKRSIKSHLLAYFGGHHSAERRALVVYKSSLIPPQTALLFCPGDIKIHSDNAKDDDITILTIPKHRLKIHVPSSQADHLLKVREMLWNTFKYYIERNIKQLDFEEHTKVSTFKVSLIKTVGRILVEGQRELRDGRTGEKDFT